VTVTGTSGSLSHYATVAYTVTGVPDFTISASPAIVTVVTGTAGTSTITVTALNGFNSPVNLSVKTNSTNLTCTLSPTTVTGGSGASTLTCTGSAAGNYLATVTGASETLSHSTTVMFTVTSSTAKVLLTFSAFDADDWDNGVGQLQVFVNGHLVVDIPAGLNHLTGSGDFAPYENRWINFGPFDITSFVVNGQNNITFTDLNPADHFSIVKNVKIVQGSTTLLNVRGAAGIDDDESRTYTFSIPPLVITSFTASNTSPVVGQNITFTATYTGGTAPFSCLFSFGDGHFGFVKGSSGSCSVTHTYSYSGAFKAFIVVKGASTSDLVKGNLTVTVGLAPTVSSAAIVVQTDDNA